jgi:uncharacterized protein Usg
MSDLRTQLRGFRLTTAEITYHLPDHPNILQTYIFQNFDTAPQYPALRKFLDFWQRELEGKIHSVKVGNAVLISPNEIKHTGTELRLN